MAPPNPKPPVINRAPVLVDVDAVALVKFIAVALDAPRPVTVASVSFSIAATVMIFVAVLALIVIRPDPAILNVSALLAAEMAVAPTVIFLNIF